MTKIPLCVKCKHFNPKSNRERQFCEAFPNQIPEEIWSANHSHITPFDGDNGIQFEDNGSWIVPDGMKRKT